MLARRAARRARTEKLRDRVDVVDDEEEKGVFREFAWRGRARSVVVVGSWDGWLHHRLLPSRGIPGFTAGVRVPSGVWAYKFLVDGVWCVDEGAGGVEIGREGVRQHRLVVDDDRRELARKRPGLVDGRRGGEAGRIASGGAGAGADGGSFGRLPTDRMTRHGRVPGGRNSGGLRASRGRIASVAGAGNNKVLRAAFRDKRDDYDGVAGGRNTVVRSASASAVPSASHMGLYGRSAASVSDAEESTYGSKKAIVPPRGSSFTTPSAAPGSISQHQLDHRKSLLQRVGSGWMRRFSARPQFEDAFSAVSNNALNDAPEDNGLASAPANGSSVQFGSYRVVRGTHPTPAQMDRVSAPGQSKDRGAAPGQSKDRVSLFPSSSDSRVGRSTYDHHDKENNGGGSMWSALAAVATPERAGSRRMGSLRGSVRNSGVKVSGPTKVDEPRDAAEVGKQADNWRQMARHLQEDLRDPTGARELFTRAIQHREKHGLWCTVENAQSHVDLARNLSKAESMNEAEFHLRIALRIYQQVKAGPEHIGDLLHYIGVVVDRQKKRAEAEHLYKQALTTYKENRLTGNNVDIALKNLSLNLKKQNRDGEVEKYIREYYDMGAPSGPALQAGVPALAPVPITSLPSAVPRSSVAPLS